MILVIANLYGTFMNKGCFKYLLYPKTCLSP